MQNLQSRTQQEREFALAIGLKSTDRFLPPGQEENLKKFFLNGEQFDRIALTGDDVSVDTFLMAIQCLAPGGLLAVPLTDNGPGSGLDAMRILVQDNYPTANMWVLNLEQGPLFLTDAHGAPWSV